MDRRPPLCFGFGLGLVMQVLTVAVQNVVRPADLGAATSDALHNVFVGVLPVAALAFLLIWFLEEVPLRSTRVEVDPGESGDEQLRAA